MLTAGGQQAESDVEDVTTEVSLDGQLATVTSEDDAADGGWTATVVIAGSATSPPPLEVERRYDLSDDQSVDVGFSVALAPVS